MRVILSKSSLSPFFNLASEQYLLEGKDDVFMLWRNGKSVIIGKNQNAYSEINSHFCEENGITIARRLTGGGAVFHDEGNINFSFITDKIESGIDFGRFIQPITEALTLFGLNAEKNGRNDITVDGFKISGNAQTVYNTSDGRERLLHHGTLLFSADITDMVGALAVKSEKLESKGIKSVSSRVKNITAFDGYCGSKDPESIMNTLINFAEEKYNIKAEDFSENEKQIINTIAKQKFSTWDWVYGSSPEYKNFVTKRFPFGIVEIGFTAKKGVITSMNISGDFFGENDVSLLSSKLISTRLIKSELSEKLSDINKYISGATATDIAEMILEVKSD